VSARRRALRPFTVTAVVKARMRVLGFTAAELADRAEVSLGTVTYLALLTHDRETLERLSLALVSVLIDHDIGWCQV
jgi:hypothetical protein